MKIQIEETVYGSESLSRDVSITLLKPDGISPAIISNLLILNDGQDVPKLQLEATLESLYEQQKIQPLLIAAVHANKDRMQEYGVAAIPDFKKRGSKAAAYTSFITNELFPFLHQYAQQDAFATTAVAGCSLGGLTALDMAWHHPQFFDMAGVFSGAFWWRSMPVKKGYSDLEHRIMHRIIRESNVKPDLKFWFEAGTKEEGSDRNHNGIIDVIDDTVDIIKELEAKGYRRPEDIIYREIVGGRHDLETWAQQMPHFLSWAFGQ